MVLGKDAPSQMTTHRPFQARALLPSFLCDGVAIHLHRREASRAPCPPDRRNQRKTTWNPSALVTTTSRASTGRLPACLLATSLLRTGTDRSIPGSETRCDGKDETRRTNQVPRHQDSANLRIRPHRSRAPRSTPAHACDFSQTGFGSEGPIGGTSRHRANRKRTPDSGANHSTCRTRATPAAPRNETGSPRATTTSLPGPYCDLITGAMSAPKATVENTRKKPPSNDYYKLPGSLRREPQTPSYFATVL